MRSIVVRRRAKRRLWSAGVAAFAALACCGVAYAARTSAMAEVHATINQALKILANPAYKAEPEAKRAKLRNLLDDHFDFDAMARSSLGANWKKLNHAQQKRFVQAFRRFIERHYVNIVEGYSGQKIEYVRQSADGPGRAEVSTKVVDPRLATPLEINYQLKRENGTWITYDLSIAGISEVASYRDEYNDIFQRQGLAGVLRKLATAQ